MKSFFIFSLKVVVSFVLIAFYLFYFSNRYFVSLGGKCLTIIEKNHSYYVINGIFLGMNIPQTTLRVEASHLGSDNGMSIYDTNKTDCSFYIEGDTITGSLGSGICIMDSNITKMLTEQFMRVYDEKKLLGNLYYEALGKSHSKAIHLQTGYKEAFHISTGYSLVGGGTMATKESAGIHSTVRTPLHPLIYSLVIILTSVAVMRYFIKKPILNDKPLKEKFKIVSDFAIKAVGESIIVAIVDALLLVVAFIIKVNWI